MAEKHQKVSADIIYTKVDEAPELASGSLLPIIRAFLKSSNITIDLKDISLSGRILAKFPSYLSKDQIRPDDLNLLGEIVKLACSSHTSETNVAPTKFIKSIPVKTLKTNGKLIFNSYFVIC